MPSILNGKNGQIELIRFLCAISIVFTHMHYLEILPWGHRAVDMFFLLSGFLMMNSIEKRFSNQLIKDAWGLLHETASFVQGKIRRIYPELFISVFIALLAYIAMAHDPIVLMCKNLARVFVGDICMLRMSGIIYYADPANGVTWYIFAMLIGLTFLYPLVRRYGVSLLLFVVCACLLGYQLRTVGSWHRYWDLMGVTLWGNVHAFAAMGLGACAYPLTKRFAGLPLRSCFRLLCDVMQLMSLCAVVLLILRKGTAHDGPGLFIFFAFILMILTFSGQGVLSKSFNNRIFYALGSFSLPLYLSHRCYTMYMQYYFPERLEYIIAVLICSVLTALAVMLGAKLWRRYLTAENMCRWFLQPRGKGIE